MEGQETNVKSNFAFSGVTAIAWISGFQKLVVLNMLYILWLQFCNWRWLKWLIAKLKDGRGKYCNLVTRGVFLLV